MKFFRKKQVQDGDIFIKDEKPCFVLSVSENGTVQYLTEKGRKKECAASDVSVVAKMKDDDFKKMKEKLSFRKKDEVVGKSFISFAEFKKDASFAKKDDAKQEVSGIATNEAIDHYGDIVEYEAIKKALPEYMEYGNIREMHGDSAAGTVKSYELNEQEKSLSITAKVVDPTAWLKVVEGVYKGFSIGGRIVDCELLQITVTDENDKEYSIYTGGFRITEIDLIEISLVDRPANPEALITSYKSFSSKFINTMKEEEKNDSLTKASSQDSITIENILFKMCMKRHDKAKDAIKKMFDENGVAFDKSSTEDLKITKGEFCEAIEQFVLKSIDAVDAEEGVETPTVPPVPPVTEEKPTETPEPPTTPDETETEKMLKKVLADNAALQETLKSMQENFAKYAPTQQASGTSEVKDGTAAMFKGVF